MEKRKLKRWIHSKDVVQAAPAAVTPSNSGKATSATVFWKITAVIVTTCALAWVLRLLVQAWPELSARRLEIDPRLLLVGLLLAVVAALLAFRAFAMILHTFVASRLRQRELAHLYFTSQLLKHLPGRVWGIGYQWAASGRVHSLGSWVRANLVHTVLATYFALWSSSLVLASFLMPTWGVLIAAAGVAGYLMLWRVSGVIPSMRWLMAKVGRPVSMDRARNLDVLADVPMGVRSRIFALFVLIWVITYIAWFFNGEAYAPLGGIGGIRMCAFYMIAWFVGYISLLTPSGLGVRELAFAWLAKDFPPDAIALMAVVGRFNLLAVDLLLGLLYAPFAPRSSRSS